MGWETVVCEEPDGDAIPPHDQPVTVMLDLMHPNRPRGRLGGGEIVKDIPWLRLDAIEAGGSGVLAAVTAILRINTKGGQLAGACNEAGTIMAVPYAADFMFLKK
jgi:Protein of unknown function (DUF3455)